MTLPTCPICQNDIPADRIMAGRAYCSCGAVLSTAAAIDRQKDTGSGAAALWIVAFTVFLIAGFLHAVNWDTYFFQIIPLKMKQMLSVASAEDLRQITSICQERKKAQCEAQAIEQLVLKDRAEWRRLPRAAELHVQLSNFRNARDHYRSYFRSGGKDDAVRFEYAKVLVALGEKRAARDQYRYLLHAPEMKLRLAVARSYVGFLMDSNDYVTAKKVIDSFRSKGREMSYFMEKELKVVVQNIEGKSRTVATRKKEATFDP